MILSNAQQHWLQWLRRIGGKARIAGQHVVSTVDPENRTNSAAPLTFLFLVSKGLVRGKNDELYLTAYGYRQCDETPPLEMEDPDTDAKRLDFLAAECAELRCVEERGYDDSDIRYEVITFYQAKPRERTWGVGRSPRDAIDDALHTRLYVPEYCSEPTQHGEGCSCPKASKEATA